MPPNVKKFQLLGYIAAAIGIIYTWYNGLDWAYSGTFADTIAGVNVQMSMPLAQGIAFAFFVITALLVWFAAQRRQSWAKWALLVLFLVDLYFPVRAFVESMSAIMRTASVVQIVLPIVAFYFVFTGDSRAWFSNTHSSAVKHDHALIGLPTEVTLA